MTRNLNKDTINYNITAISKRIPYNTKVIKKMYKLFFKSISTIN